MLIQYCVWNLEPCSISAVLYQPQIYIYTISNPQNARDHVRKAHCSSADLFFPVSPSFLSPSRGSGRSFHPPTPCSSSPLSFFHPGERDTIVVFYDPSDPLPTKSLKHTNLTHTNPHLGSFLTLSPVRSRHSSPFILSFQHFLSNCSRSDHKSIQMT